MLFLQSSSLSLRCSMRARPVTRRQSVSNFKSGAKVHPRNNIRPMRGGIRL